MSEFLFLLAVLSLASGSSNKGGSRKVQGTAPGGPGGFLDMFAKKAAADRKKKRAQ
jgi:tripartite-type tricarboxylate transporter receptor subunit TctC